MSQHFRIYYNIEQKNIKTPTSSAERLTFSLYAGITAALFSIFLLFDYANTFGQ